MRHAAAHAPPTPIALYVRAPDDTHAGQFVLVRDDGVRPNGYPLWKHKAKELWMYSGNNGKWYIGSETERVLDFQCAQGRIHTDTPHGGRMPHEMGGWMRTTELYPKGSTAAERTGWLKVPLSVQDDGITVVQVEDVLEEEEHIVAFLVGQLVRYRDKGEQWKTGSVVEVADGRPKLPVSPDHAVTFFWDEVEDAARPEADELHVSAPNGQQQSGPAVEKPHDLTCSIQKLSVGATAIINHEFTSDCMAKIVLGVGLNGIVTKICDDVYKGIWICFEGKDRLVVPCNFKYIDFCTAEGKKREEQENREGKEARRRREGNKREEIREKEEKETREKKKLARPRGASQPF